MSAFLDSRTSEPCGTNLNVRAIPERGRHKSSRLQCNSDQAGSTCYLHAWDATKFRAPQSFRLVANSF